MRTPTAVLTTVFIGVVALTGRGLAQRGTDAAEFDQRHPAAAASAHATETPQTRAGMHDMSAMMAKMHANDAKLDQLVKKMQSATGAAKTDAVAELLAALVEDRKTACEPMMAHMMSMMNRDNTPTRD